MAQKVKVATHGELKPGDKKLVDVEGTPVFLFYTGEKYYALLDSCCHRGGPLSEGTVEGGVVSCPWHGWEFDLETGECKTNPGVSQPVYQVSIEGDEVVVLLP
jgi:nitrite reductase/ring-hydroxylating ferredoxin subunit